MIKSRLALIVFFVSLIVVVASVSYIGYLSEKLETEETKKMAIWAEATQLFILADEDTDIDFYTTIIEENTTIPVYMTDDEGKIILSRNADESRTDVEGLHGPIEVKISDDIRQYIYYDDSTLLRQLHYFPYIQLTLILIFLIVGITALVMGARGEQNRVWVGLSKETAHQLGTPISSLNAWIDLLQSTYPNDNMIPQMKRDVDRLHVIADRFSKVGSAPELTPQRIMPILSETIDYMRTRISKHVSITMIGDAKNMILISAPLFVWVIENLIRNAVDAMDGSGNITILVSEDVSFVYIDVTDTGRGMSRKEKSRAFLPGFTTKKRGWGLGLSLSKRIIEDYHRGKLFIKSSELGTGTTFRIILKQSVDC